MSLKTYLQKLEKKRIISRKPNPAIPFILAIIIYFLYLYASSTPEIPIFFSKFSLYLLIFTLVFALLHLIVYKILISK